MSWTGDPSYPGETPITQQQREQVNRHKAFALWFTGLPGSGKTTLAQALEAELFARNYQCYVLDGDRLRHGLNRDLGFSPQDRAENIRRVGEVARLMVDAGIIVISAFISPYLADQDKVRSLFPPGHFFEVFLKCSLEICEKRDPKGLYRKARQGVIYSFTGVSAPYEPPVAPELKICTGELSVGESLDVLLDFVLKLICPP